MDKKKLKELGRLFYTLYKEYAVQFEYSPAGMNLELETERIIGLIDYVIGKKEAIKK